MNACLICDRPTLQLSMVANTACQGRDVTGINCPHCGEFLLTGSAASQVSDWGIPRDPMHQARMSHAIRRLQLGRASSTPLLLNENDLERLWQESELPTPREQADNLILLLGDLLMGDPSGNVPASHEHHGAIAGASSQEGLFFILEGLKKIDAVEEAPWGEAYRLTFAGWDRYEELKRGRAFGRTAFMAMKFGDPILDRIVEKHFKPAVAETGFRLKLLNENQPAGLIDDHLRVEIKRARFLIADLTHANKAPIGRPAMPRGWAKPSFTPAPRTCSTTSRGAPTSIPTTTSR